MLKKYFSVLFSILMFISNVSPVYAEDSQTDPAETTEISEEDRAQDELENSYTGDYETQETHLEEAADEQNEQPKYYEETEEQPNENSDASVIANPEETVAGEEEIEQETISEEAEQETVPEEANDELVYFYSFEGSVVAEHGSTVTLYDEEYNEISTVSVESDGSFVFDEIEVKNEDCFYIAEILKLVIRRVFRSNRKNLIYHIETSISHQRHFKICPFC